MGQHFLGFFITAPNESINLFFLLLHAPLNGRGQKEDDILNNVGIARIRRIGNYLTKVIINNDFEVCLLFDFAIGGHDLTFAVINMTFDQGGVAVIHLGQQKDEAIAHIFIDDCTAAFFFFHTNIIANLTRLINEKDTIYWRLITWRARDDLNVRPQPSEGCALSGLSYERINVINDTAKSREKHFNLLIS